MEGNRTANVSARLRIGTELFPLHRRRGVDPALPVQNDSPANQEGGAPEGQHNKFARVHFLTCNQSNRYAMRLWRSMAYYR
ncbi:hypothetical protein VTN49DRAFT_613 [Thermomyces lanuginosus]|uniref:uncharacterized protein n=1 Tax=Thermomyces lanuginosus TaxID=5541 RepID=UPI0037427DD9